MRTPVTCKNCGIRWVRVTNSGSEVEYTEDLQYNCPNCGSNDYKARLKLTSGQHTEWE